jgi:hypothetical protein
MPYIFFTQKGNPARAEEMMGSTPTDYLLFSTSVHARTGVGSMSPLSAGPALEWQFLHWNYMSGGVQTFNEIEILGAKTGGLFAPLKTYGKAQKFVDLRRDIKDLNTYRNLLPITHFYDPQLQQTPQPKQTNLFYREVPELCLHPAYRFLLHRDTLLKGEPLLAVCGVANLSHVAADSIRIRVSVSDARGNEVWNKVLGKAPIAGFAQRSDSAEVPTRGLGGAYIFTFEINPTDSLWQPEKYHFNNSFSRPFFVVGDGTNPLIDVTFDGRRILDGDIVSARPEIVITAKDDNPFMMLNDTSLFEVWLEYPDKRVERLPFDHPDEHKMLHFKPADNPGNKAEIKYRPLLTTDGVYTLRTRAADVSGNASGKFDYEIRFEVINRSTITHVMNYPNPFSTATRFVYTLTGWKIPEVFTIQILSISGRVVREITRDELGAVYIGRNISDYVWDGTDEFGDRLANGVYFYRVISKIEGEQVERRSSGADVWFKKDFGKMYLMK